MKKSLISSVTILAILYCISPAVAQNTLGGHFGIVHPLVTFSEGETSSISDQYAVGFPIGVTSKLKDNLAFDVEIVPFISDGQVNNFLIHPGLLHGLGGGFTFGYRMAFEINTQAYGFTPLLNKGFAIGQEGKQKLFVELVLPVRFGKQISETGTEDNFSAYTIALHTGIAF